MSDPRMIEPKKEVQNACMGKQAPVNINYLNQKVNSKNNPNNSLCL